jgi:hypothetical protein
MSKLLQGNSYTHADSSHFWLSSDSPERYEECKIDSNYRKRWEGVKIIYDLNQEGYRAKEWDKINWSESVVMLGDSNTLGLGIPFKDTVTQKLTGQLGKLVVNLGVGGCSNLFMLYNAAKVIEHFNPWGMIIQWSAAERFPKFSKPHTGNSGVHHMGSWEDDVHYNNIWIKGDNFLYHDQYIKQTARQLNSNRFLDYTPSLWREEYDNDYILPMSDGEWLKELNGEVYGRDNMHPSGVVYKKWSEVIHGDIIKNGWLD